MNIFNKEIFSKLSQFGLGIGGLFSFKKAQEQLEIIQKQKVLENLVNREKMINILLTIKYKMKFYHRLAISISKQLEKKPESEREKSREEFLEKFLQNDYRVITKNIAQYEFGVLYEDFIESLDYYVNQNDDEISNIDAEIEKEFVSNLNGNKTLLAPNKLLADKLDKETAKELFKETLQCVKEYKKQNQKLEETREYFTHFNNIYNDMDQKLSQLLVLDTDISNERNFNCFFELLVYYCENDFDYSAFIREMEIQSILLYNRIQQQTDNTDYNYIKSQFQNI